MTGGTWGQAEEMKQGLLRSCACACGRVCVYVCTRVCARVCVAVVVVVGGRFSGEEFAFSSDRDQEVIHSSKGIKQTGSGSTDGSAHAHLCSSKAVSFPTPKSLAPDSRLCCSAQAIVLRCPRELSAVPLRGPVQTAGPGACLSVRMPEGSPWKARPSSRDGGPADQPAVR